MSYRPECSSSVAAHLCSVAFTVDRYGQMFPEADTMAATTLDGVRLANQDVAAVR